MSWIASHDAAGDGQRLTFSAVMGDVGRGLYVSQEVIPVYKSMLRLATIITPNQFEVESVRNIRDFVRSDGPQAPFRDTNNILADITPGAAETP